MLTDTATPLGRAGTADELRIPLSRAHWTPPARIVSVWIIGLSTFQHRTACAELADVAVHDESGTIIVL
jgi:hypothetical protein